MKVHRKSTTEYSLFDHREVFDFIWDALKHSCSPLGATPEGPGFPMVSVSYLSGAGICPQYCRVSRMSLQAYL